MSTPQRPRLQRLPYISTDVPCTPPPPMYAPGLTHSPSSTFSPASSLPSTPVTPRGEREIIMGGIVMRTPSASYIGGEDEDEDRWDEKRQASIEVPGIVLTEPLPDLPPRTPSPPPKSILLLPPASLPIPEKPNPISAHRPFSPAFSSIINGRKNSSIGTMTIRTVLLLGAVSLGAWHLWTTLDMGSLTEDIAVQGL